MKILVQGHTGLVRDTKSGAIINMSNGGEQYSANREKKIADAARLNKVEQDVSEIKRMLAIRDFKSQQDGAEIKDMLKQLLIER